MRRALQRVAFAALYRTGRWVYDPLTRLIFGEAWDAWRRLPLEDITTDPVLDIGCGTGVLLAELEAAGLYAVGLDQSPSMLSRARLRLRNNRTPLVRGDMRRLPFADRALRACVATFPSGSILERPTLDEVARVLDTGGVFIVVLGGHLAREVRRPPPIPQLLRLLYGADERDPPPTRLLAHPALPGKWERRRTLWGDADVWVAYRASRDATGTAEEVEC